MLKNRLNDGFLQHYDQYYGRCILELMFTNFSFDN
jgi:hypothetical protein